MMEQIKTPTGEIIYKDNLQNGLTVFLLPKPGFLRTYAVLSTKYGSIDSSFKAFGKDVVNVPPGIAHFLEHKLFEEEEGNVFERFASFGASVNAFTSHTQTSYLFATIEDWQKALVQLIEFVNKPYLTEDNVEKEKGIIEQELRMYEDHPDQRLHTSVLENLYYQNPVRLDIGGTVESVNQITVDDLLLCYRNFYQPGNMALAIVGAIDPTEALQIIKDNYPEWEHYNGTIERVHPEEPAKVQNSWVEEKLQISRPRYLVGFKHDPIWQGEDLLRQQIIMGLVWRLITGRGSKYFTQLYDANLVDNSFGASFSGDMRFAYSMIGSDTDEPERLHGELTKIINGLKAEKLEPAQVERLKRQLYGRHIASYDSFEYVANRYISHHFDNAPYHLFLDMVQNISPSDLQDAIVNLLDWERSTVSILRPVSFSE